MSKNWPALQIAVLAVLESIRSGLGKKGLDALLSQVWDYLESRVVAKTLFTGSEKEMRIISKPGESVLKIDSLMEEMVLAKPSLKERNLWLVLNFGTKLVLEYLRIGGTQKNLEMFVSEAWNHLKTRVVVKTAFEGTPNETKIVVRKNSDILPLEKIMEAMVEKKVLFEGTELEMTSFQIRR
ncbi:MAG: hypothetical protein A2908_01410 [Candidatus Staskawiczbacteria bacterium RIFCSPLOWO2_01_FULL_38_12b]|uniref:Uncharacterized protein n=1 Tax=Candidatus Staskawiczbacteria bacterium RIFCSPLOWO2_01_FULL_38_12b TaxID=1802214 RepID=A0A1G2ID68_9BACT|nr:MAG: hypothetical protein A2908_01410 [Candidatus Staskawiczbacteria bacterium RIFCSPLOWO2_01_FULL_38_12b]